MVEFVFCLLVFGGKFLRLWNLFDLLMILVIVALFVADAIVRDFYPSAVFKLRALCRIYRITLLVQDLLDTEVEYRISKIKSIRKSPVEEVSEILNGLARKAKR